MAYTPRVFTKNVWNESSQTFALQTKTARTIREDVELLFDGWSPGALLPDNGSDFATEAYVVATATEIAHREALIIAKGDKGDTGIGMPASGLPVLATNLATNGSLELNTTGWAIVNTGTGPASSFARSTAKAYSGTASLLHTVGNVVTVDSGPGHAVSLVSGKTYTAAAMVWQDAQVGTGLRLCAFGPALPSTAQGTFFTTTLGAWVMVYVTFTATATGTATVFIGCASGTPPTSGSTFHVDALTVVEGSTPMIFDGSTIGARWTGTANSSTSELLLPSTPATIAALAANSTTISNETSLNAVRAPGEYVVNYTANWAARVMPVSDGGFLTVRRPGSSGTITQSFIQHGATYNYHRASTNSGVSWTAWMAEGKGAVDTHAGLADPHTVYAKKAGEVFTGAVQIHRTTPIVHVYNRTDLATDAKRWDVAVENDGNYTVRATNDAGGTLKSPLIMTRGGTVVIDGIHHVKGTGSPEGAIAAPVGSRYVDTAATNGAIEWIKATGAGNTGWKVMYGDTGWRNISASLMNGWTGTVMLRRYNDGVELNLFNLAVGTGTQLLSIPLGFRAIKNSNFLLRASTTGQDVVNGSFDTAGSLHVTLSSIVPNTNSHTVMWSAGGLSWPTGALPGTAG